MQRGQYEKLGNADETVRAAAASYRERMAEFAEMKVLDTWYTQVTFDAIKEYFRKDSDISARLAKKRNEGTLANL